MSDYTPTTDEVRSMFCVGVSTAPKPVPAREAYAGFDRWLAAVRADQIEQMITAAWDTAQSQYNKGHAESAFGANLVREHFVAIRAQLPAIVSEPSTPAQEGKR